MSKKWDYIFFILLAAISLLYGYQHILFLRPYSIHQWRQCDCLSITYNYYKEGMHFFSPAVHWSGPTGDGKTCTSECPLLYYAVACLWTIFGYHEFIYRLLDTFIAFCGLYCLYKIAKDVLQDGAWAVIVSLLLFSSTIFAYYANNFTTDVPSLSLAIIAWYHFLKFYRTSENKSFYRWAFFCLLAGLTKITALISFVPLFLILPLEAIGNFKFKNTEALFKQPLKQAITFASIIAIIGLWTLYAMHYNNLHLKGLFSTQTFPIYKLRKQEILDILTLLCTLQFPVFLNIPALFLVMGLFIILLINYKQVNKLLLFITVGVFIGCILYLLLWFQVFNVHDYYLINLLIFIPFTVLAFLHYLKKNQQLLFSSSKTKLVAFIILGFSVYDCTVKTNIRYSNQSPFVINNFTLNKETTDYWSWYQSYYSSYFKALETITPYLRSLGIKRTDKVISIPDESINISLYLMDQKGFSDFYFDDVATQDRINKFIELGAKYLIINDPALLDSLTIKPYLTNKLGVYKNVSIYKLNGTIKMDINTERLKGFINKIKSDTAWLSQITRGAKERNISVDSALMLNAIWLSEHNGKL